MPEGAPPRLPAHPLHPDHGQDARGAPDAVSLLAEVQEVLAAAPAALITDIDGTISPIVARPEDATVSDAIRCALEKLAGRLPLVAVVTGRDEATARRLVGASGITYIGNYGLDAGAIELAGLAAAEEEARLLLKGIE